MAELNFYTHFPTKESIASLLIAHASEPQKDEDIEAVASCFFSDSCEEKELLNIIHLFKIILSEYYKSNLEFVDAIEKVFDRSSDKANLVKRAIERMQWICIDIDMMQS